jgi:hypothetical protein
LLLKGGPHTIEGHLKVPDDGAEGVIVANSDFIGGFALWIDDEGLLEPYLPVPGRGDLQANLDASSPDR